MPQRLFWGHSQKPIPAGSLGIDPALIASDSVQLPINQRGERRAVAGSKYSMGLLIDRLLPPEPGKRKRARKHLVMAVAAQVLTARVVAQALGVSRSLVRASMRRYRVALPVLVAELEHHARRGECETQGGPERPRNDHDTDRAER